MKNNRIKYFANFYISKLYRGFDILPILRIYYTGQFDRGFRVQIELSFLCFRLFMGRYDQ